MKRLLFLLMILAVTVLFVVGCANNEDTTNTDLHSSASESTSETVTSTSVSDSSSTDPQTTSTVSTSESGPDSSSAVTTATDDPLPPVITTATPPITTTEPQVTVTPPTTEMPSSYRYTDFTSSEKSSYMSAVGFVIPFMPTDDYYFEAYNEDGYRGVYFSAECRQESDFTKYLTQFDRYTNDGTDVDDDGDTWYLFSSGEVFIDVCFYNSDGVYYVDVDVYVSSDFSDLPDYPDSGTDDEPITENEELITNKGAGLPDSTANGIYDIDFTKAENVKDVTDQGSYLDGCPPVGSPDVLVIPVEFRDITAQSKGYSIDQLVAAFSPNGKTDYYSVYDYFYISSYGKVTLDITVLDSWFKPSQSSSYYASKTIDYYGEEVAVGEQIILNEALDYLDDFMDLSRFDSDNNGTIDSVVMVSTLTISEESDYYWAFRYWNLYTDDDGYYYEYDGVSANDYLWIPYQFLHESYDAFGNVSYTDSSVMNTYTFIHEFSHILGADDYYDTTYESDPLQGYDIMDSMTGDHNAFTKINLGWITTSRLIVTNTSVTVTLKDFSASGDTIIVASNWDDSLGAYQEYYLITYYTNTKLNAGEYGYFDQNSILVYHVNASLYAEEYEGEVYYDIYNNNTSPSDSYGTSDNLIEFVTAQNGSVQFVRGSTLPTCRDDQGNTLPYTFTVDQLTDSEATLTFTKR